MDRVFSTAELAERYAGISTLTLTDWRYRGNGPRYFRAGKRVFYREADVLAWEAEQEAAVRKESA
jgi:hypothetical protein